MRDITKKCSIFLLTLLLTCLLYTSGKEKLQEQYILQNTAKMNLDRATEQKNERETVFAGLHAERAEIEEQLTKDYVANLVRAAPMHDVGKIAIPDAILQKPGKLDVYKRQSQRSTVL